MPSKVYVYEDTDNNKVEVFKTLQAAKEYCYDQWGKECVEEFGWDEGKTSWSTCEYVTIYERVVK